MLRKLMDIKTHQFKNVNLYRFFADCMKLLLRSEDFIPGWHIKVSSEYYALGDRRRLVKEGAPWCAKPGDRFGEWAQVDLGKTGFPFKRE